ncbi:MAG: ABC transporter permease subunit [Firmicutes bacterium]|nr:ABC transporter permease subunit [Bacillota bacterium]MCR4712239.1 ABC transporter permease subunit [Clostridia bacterium]
MIGKETRGYEVSKVLMLTFFAVFLLFPILKVMSSMTMETFLATIHTTAFKLALKRSLIVAASAMVIAISIAYVSAWAITRTGAPLKSFFTIVLTLPMLIPSYSHASGLVLLFGQNGILTKALHLDALFGASSYIYGIPGIILGSVMFSVPIAFIMIADIMRYQDYTPFEAAEVLGIPKKNRFLSISFPYFRKPLISVMFVVFTSVITDYGVPHIIGGKSITVAEMMFQKTVKLLDYDTGSVLGMVLLVPAVVSFIMDFTNKDKGNMAFVGKKFPIIRSAGRDALASLWLVVISLFLMIPFFTAAFNSLIVSYPNNLSLTGQHYQTVVFKSGFVYLRNSLLIAVVVSLVGICMVTIVAYLSARMKSKLSRALHLVSMTAMAVPGIVLGLSYVIVFKKSPIYNTFYIMFLVNMVHMFASPYLMMYNTFGKLNENLENVGITLGVSRLRMIKDVILPLSKSTIWDAMSYFFVQCMKTITAVAFLWSTYTKPLAIKIDEYNAMIETGNVAVATILIFAVNLTFKAIVYLRQQSIAKAALREGDVEVPADFAARAKAY